MKKRIRNNLWTMAIAITSLAMSVTACSNDDREAEKPFTTNPVESSTLYACGVSQDGTRSVTDAANVVFTEDDILWFDVNTRELRFKDMDEPLYKKLEPYHEIEIRLGNDALFVVSSFVGLWDSRIIYNLVLCYGNIEKDTPEIDGYYYLYDCYPLQFINDDSVQANIMKNATQWETFTKYLEGKGKLRK